MATIDDFFLAHGLAFSGFNTFLTRNGNPSFTVGVAGFGNRNGVYGQTEVIDVPRLVAGVYGTAATQPGVIGFSRDAMVRRVRRSPGLRFAPCRSSARGSTPSRARSPASLASATRRDRRSA